MFMDPAFRSSQSTRKCRKIIKYVITMHVQERREAS
jgi:hypothetical protein